MQMPQIILLSKRTLLTLIGVLFLIVASAQNKSINDIKEQLRPLKRDDTTKLKLYLNLSLRYMNQQVDSALKYAIISKRIADQLKHKKFQLEALEYLGRAHVGKGNFNEALLTFQKEEQLASTYAEKAQTVRNQGNIYIELGQPDQAIHMYKKSLDLAYLSKDKLTIALSLANIAYVYRQQAKFEEAVSYLIKAVQIAEEIDNKTLLAGIYIQLALIQYNRKIYADAKKYASEALPLYHASENKQGSATALTIIGGCFSEENDFINAKKYIEQAYSLNKALGDKRQIATSSSNLAEIELSLKNYEQCIKYCNAAITELKALNVVINLIGTYITRGKALIALKQLDDAKQDIELALKLSRTGRYKAQERRATEAMALLNAAEGNHAHAFELMLKTNVLNDSILNESNSRQINELRTQYETEKKQKEIILLNDKNKLQQLSLANKNLEIEKQLLSINNQQLDINNKDLLIQQKENDVKQKSLLTNQQKQKIQSLNQENQIQALAIKQRNTYLIIALLLFLFLVSTGYFIYNKRQLKAKAQLQEEINKQQDLAARAVLVAEERERRRIAGDLHDGVGQLLSAALMNLNGMFQKLKLTGEMGLQAEQTLSIVNDSYDEMRSISHQMMPNALLKSGLAFAVKEFLDKIDKDMIKINLETIGLSQRLDEQTETVLYRVIQETVSNVIKHAEANKLDIVLIKDEEGISITIEDNGKGFDKSKTDLRTGMGMGNILSRVEFLKGTVDIDSTIGKGTLVAIFIPL